MCLLQSITPRRQRDPLWGKQNTQMQEPKNFGGPWVSIEVSPQVVKQTQEPNCFGCSALPHSTAVLGGDPPSPTATPPH